MVRRLAAVKTMEWRSSRGKDAGKNLLMVLLRVSTSGARGGTNGTVVAQLDGKVLISAETALSVELAGEDGGARGEDGGERDEDGIDVNEDGVASQVTDIRIMRYRGKRRGAIARSKQL